MPTNPRNWQPPDDEGWEKAADSAKHQRWSLQGNTLIKWGWVAMFVIVGLAIALGKM